VRASSLAALTPSECSTGPSRSMAMEPSFAILSTGASGGESAVDDDLGKIKSKSNVLDYDQINI
jgi:hypothetical protein